MYFECIRTFLRPEDAETYGELGRKSYLYAKFLPIKLPRGVEHTMKRFHIEVVAPGGHLVNTVVAGLTVRAVKEKSVGSRVILGDIAVDKRIHNTLTGIVIESAIWVVFVHMLDSLEHSANGYSSAG